MRGNKMYKCYHSDVSCGGCPFFDECPVQEEIEKLYDKITELESRPLIHDVEAQ